MATLTDLRAEVTRELGLDNTAGTASGQQTQIDLWLNRAVRKVLRDTHCYVTTQTVTPGATEDYTLTSSVLDIVDMTFSTSSFTARLERLTVPDLLQLRSQGATASRTTHFALAGNNTILFYPTPGATDTVKMYYVPAPTAMASGAHDSSSTSPTNYGGIPVDYDYLIELWAEHMLASTIGHERSAQGSRYLERYREGVRECRRDLNRKGGHRAPKILVGGPRQVVRSRSQDLGVW